jgi:hypothetical protein
MDTSEVPSIFVRHVENNNDKLNRWIRCVNTFFKMYFPTSVCSDICAIGGVPPPTSAAHARKSTTFKSRQLHATRVRFSFPDNYHVCLGHFPIFFPPLPFPSFVFLLKIASINIHRNASRTIGSKTEIVTDNSRRYHQNFPQTPLCRHFPTCQRRSNVT